MGTTNISSIGKIFAQGQTADVNGSAQEEDIKIAFADVMSQMSAMAGNNLLAGKELTDPQKNLMTVEGAVSQQDYDRYQYRETNIKERPKMDWKENSQASEKLDEFADEVKEVLKEELGVSEEQITDAMETLGLTFADLMNPNQLAALTAELTGNGDMSALLCSSEFQEVMQAVGALTENLLKELGVSAEELGQLLELSQKEAGMNMEVPTDTAPEVTDAAPEVTDAAPEVPETEGEVMAENAPDVQTEDAPDVQAEDLTVVKEKLETQVFQPKTESHNDKAAAGEESAEDVAEVLKTDEEQSQTADASQKGNTAFENGQTSGNQDSHTANGEAAVTGQSIVETAYAQPLEGTNVVSPQVDVSNIIRQIVEFSKVTLSDTATTMEMQLNPEHLGRIYLEITSKEGIVSARITAQNEVVKEALESQLAELRQNLNQAGVKVEAVEVTVGSHEFERNLEQNAKREEQQAEEQAKAAKHTRHINLNDLEELGGLMTEEESLVARMMADQGNSIDFTA